MPLHHILHKLLDNHFKARIGGRCDGNYGMLEACLTINILYEY
jgi:hypothetical protein